MKKLFYIATMVVCCSVLLAACSQGQAPTTTKAETEAQAAPTPLPEQPTEATIVDKGQDLTICLGQEPNTLYPFASPNKAARSVLSAIFDGPIDALSNGQTPVILRSIPSFEDQSILVIPTVVKKGDTILNSKGEPVRLEVGTQIFPAGCRDTSCAVAYSGKEKVEMDQVLMTFELLPGVEWSSGQTLTSDDYVFGYELAKAQKEGSAKYLVDRTQAYEAADDLTLQWWGVPGYLSADPAAILVQPMPRELLRDVDPAAIASEYGSTIPPIGWGAFVFDSWEKGNYIRLTKNQNYFRANESLPHFDTLTFNFYPDPQQSLAAFLAGKCDMLDSGTRVDAELPLLMALADDGKATLWTSQSPITEFVQFRLGKQANTPKGATLQGLEPLANRDLRMAIAYCIDRNTIATEATAGKGSPPFTYLPDYLPSATSDLPTYDHDLKRAMEILQSIGWKDSDNNPATPRVADGVEEIPNGTSLSLRYASTDTLQRRKVGQQIAQNLAECGIDLAEQYYTADTFYKQEATGILFGHNFDLVQISTGTYGPADPCIQFTSSQISSSSTKWMGTNFSGYMNPDFDRQCNLATKNAGNAELSDAAASSAQQIFANDLPSLPLYTRLKLVVTEPSLCIRIDPGMESDLWSVESFRLGNDCFIEE